MGEGERNREGERRREGGEKDDVVRVCVRVGGFCACVCDCVISPDGGTLANGRSRVPEERRGWATDRGGCCKDDRDDMSRLGRMSMRSLSCTRA